MDDTGLLNQKADLRRRMAELRDSIDPQERLDLAEAIASCLSEVPALRDAQAVGIYYSVGSEVLTPPLIQRLVEVEGRRAFLPFVLNGELQMTEWRPSDPVVVAPYVGFQPRFSRLVPLDEIEVAVVPGLAFDRNGHRLGSGEGLYDRLLARMSPVTIKVGIGFQVQLIDSVPAGEGDTTLDVVVTDGEVVECSRSAAGANG
jgi:5-formyltetrahydrofolate cyclo-ligase